MTKIIKFSKSFKDINSIKKNFFSQNKKNLENIIKINSIYKKQPPRKKCKNCDSKKLKPFIKSFGIQYNLCICGHLNGAFQDTDKFAKQIYFEKNGKDYSKNYLKDYNLRVKNIYIPKVQFLKKVIKKKIRLLDLGCGAGHFLKALEMNNISASGFDTSKQLVKLGEKSLKKNKIHQIKFEDIYNIIENDFSSNTLSMIGVLEHLVRPGEILNSFKKSKVKYLYLALPLFSLSTFIENSFTNIFPRQLGGGHTHLYTKKSINYLAKKYNLEIIGEYWFGSDMYDLFRSLINSANKLDDKIYIQKINDNFFSVIDELQHILDKKKICSQVHIVLKKKNI